MPRFMVTHTFPTNGISRDQFCQVAEASQQAPNIRGLQSFANLSQGKVFCVWEAQKPEAVTDWFGKMKIPYETITKLEVEGRDGAVNDV